LPINKLLLWILNKTGQIEYEVMCPELAREEKRRRLFAGMLGRVKGNVIEDIDKFFGDIKKASVVGSSGAATAVSSGTGDVDVQQLLASVLATGGGLDEEGLFTRIGTLIGFLLCKRAATGAGAGADHYVSFKKALATIKAADQAAVVERQACISDVGCMRWFPVKTWPAVLLGVGELISCVLLCFYILGFAGYKSAQDAMNILETVGISQTVAILVTAPATQLAMVILGMLRNPGVVEKHYQLFLNKQAKAVAAASYGVKDVVAYLDAGALASGDLTGEDCKKLDKLYAILFRV
jgi:hypothetical protein